MALNGGYNAVLERRGNSLDAVIAAIKIIDGQSVIYLMREKAQFLPAKEGMRCLLRAYKKIKT